MNSEKLLKGRQIVSVVCAVCVLLCGASFAAAAIYLYMTGGNTPYTVESVSQWLLYLCPVYILTILSVIASGVLNVLCGDDGAKLRGAADKRDVLGKLYRRFRVSAIDRPAIGKGDRALVTDPDTYARLERENIIRRVSAAVFGVLCAVVIGLTLIPLLSPSSYNPSSDALNSSVTTLVLWALNPVVAVVGGSLVVSEIFARSYSSELELLKALIASSSPAEAPLNKPTDSTTTARIILAVRIVVILVALALIITGIATGDVENIIDKAIRICQECIGIG